MAQHVAEGGHATDGPIELVGPLYAAFPIAVSLQRKGARLANVVVFLGTWATIKAPMVMMEASFVGLRFALLRLALTVPCILATGWLMERLLGAAGSRAEAGRVADG